MNRRRVFLFLACVILAVDIHPAGAGPNRWTVSPCRSDVLVYDAYNSAGKHTGSWYYTTRKGYVWVDDAIQNSPYAQYRNRNYECGVMGAPVTPMGTYEFYGSHPGQWFQGGFLWWGQQALPIPQSQWPWVWIWTPGNWGQW